MTGNPRPIAIGIVGFGKIASTEHVPAIRASKRFVLHSVARRAPDDPTIPHYADVDSMLAAANAPDAVAICTPPQARYRIARHALESGKHVLLEKPPGTAPGEVEDLAALASESGRTLFCAWHSRFAPAVEPARAWLATRTVRSVRIDWREDVRVWHPGQKWIWDAGGLGVFDAGINALSIAATILPRPFFVCDARLRFPANCATPIAAELRFVYAGAIDMTASFDWQHSGPEIWDMHIATDDGHLTLSQGGARLRVDGSEVQVGPHAEYPALYAHFGELIAATRSDADLGPLRLVADAFLLGRREAGPPFFEN